MEYRILGTLEVLRAGEPLPLGGGKLRELLAMLLVQPGQAVPADQLIEELWGADPPATAENSLQVYVARLRKVLEPDRPPRTPPELLLTEPSGYRLEVASGQLDAMCFSELAERGSEELARSEWEHTKRSLSEALDLWRGPALVDFAYHAFAQAEIRRLDELRARAREDLVDARLGLGEHRAVIPELESLVASAPLRERPRCQLALALYRSGRGTDALSTLREARRVLAEEHGLDPSPDLAGLERSILVQDAALDLPPEPVSTHGEPPANIPVPLTSFVGRDQEREEVAELVRGPSRLVTLTGPGGSGKTRLAVEVARSVAPHFPDGTWLVRLGPLNDPDLVERAVADVLGLREDLEGDLSSALAEFLSARRTLIVLDNVEHLLESAASLVRMVLGSGTGARVLATGRESLRIEGETAMHVPSLNVPSTAEVTVDELRSSDAVLLFTDRARDRWPGFELGTRNAGDVATIVRRLDGIPLAIELAAASLGTLTEAALAQRLDDRFSLLVEGDRTAPSRHRTLRATVDWSYGLLGTDERVLFRRLAVFADTFTLEGAESVCGWDPLERRQLVPLLSRLVSTSLVSVASRESSQARYHLLETIRAYAAEVLREAGEEAQVRDRHLAHMTTRIGRLNVDLGSGRAQVPAKPSAVNWRGIHFDRAVLNDLEAERYDFRSALRWAIDGRHLGEAFSLSAAMWFPWRALGVWGELRGWLDEALSIDAEVATEPRAMALCVAASMAGEVGEWDRRIALADEALEHFQAIDHVLGMGWAHHIRGHALGALDRVEESESAYARGLEHHRQAGDPYSLAFTQFVWAWMLVGRSEHERARQMATEVGGIASEHDLDDAHAQAEAILGFLTALDGDWEEGRSRYEQAIEATTSVIELHYLLLATGRLELGRDDLLRSAKEKLAQCITIAGRIGFPERHRWELEGAAAAAGLDGSLRTAARLFGAADRAQELLGTRCPFPAQTVVDEAREALTTKLDRSMFETLFEEGRSMSMSRATDLAIASLRADAPH